MSTNLKDPRDVFITSEMTGLMRDPYFMTLARQILFKAKPLLQYEFLSNHRIMQELAATGLAQDDRQVTLHFDGKFLLWREVTDCKILRHSWSAVSGRAGYQTKEYQKLADKGPLPEGQWLVKPTEYQSAEHRSLLEKAKNEFGRGKWPGGASSWGLHRIWLHPELGTNTYGRSGFSIHGGTTAGSAGCIDMTDQITAFVKMFLDYGRTIELEAKYP